jgi:hypothetical protein
MATFNYTVDTKPMAEEMRSVSKHVTATTGAVVAMQTAVVIAEAKAAEHVCANVNRGFYSLIRSQISQKMAKLQSEVDSHLIQLLQQKKALLSIKNRMQKDYNMISARYIKLFNGLNANLKQRVFELDKPTIDFAIKEIDKIGNRTKYLSAMVPIGQNEALNASQKIISSNIKYRGQNVISSMNGFLHEMNNQKKLTDQILIKDGRIVSSSKVYSPVVIMMCNRDQNNANFEIQIPTTHFNQASKAAIQNVVFSEVDQVQWKSNTQNSELKSEFSKCLSQSSKSQRVKDLANQLFQKSNFLTT